MVIYLLLELFLAKKPGNANMDPITKSAAPFWMYIQAPGDGLHSLSGAMTVVDKYRPAAPGLSLDDVLIVSFVQY